MSQHQGRQPGNGGYGCAQGASSGAIQQSSAVNNLHGQAQNHKRNEHMGGLAGLAALGAAPFARPEHHKGHHKELSIAEAMALGPGGCALYEHHQVPYEHHQVRQDHKLEAAASHGGLKEKHHFLK